MDYSKLLDEEVWAFIDQTAAYYPGEAAGLSIEQQRAYYDAMAAGFRAPRPEMVEVTEKTVGHVSVRIYEAGDPSRTVMFCHGGGFVVGDLNSHDDVCAELCAQTGYRVVAVDYRLAPEHLHPDQFDDCWQVAEWIASTYPGGCVLAGDSAGGLLCASVAHHARGRLAGILGQVLIYPTLGGDMRKGSYIEHAHAPMLSLRDMSFYADVRLDGAAPLGDASYAPLWDRDFSGLPPTVLISADCDPLRDDCRDYRDAIVAAGGKAHWINEQGLVHSYLRARHMSAAAAASFERFSLAVEALGQEVWSFE